MNTEIGILTIIGVCILVLVIGVMKRKAEILLNFVVRIVVCLIVVYFFNAFLASRGIAVAVGINIYSILTFGFLGLCGMLALYGILFLQLL